MTRPAELKYSPSHEWTRLDDGIATVGITDFAVEQLGDLVFIDLPAGSENVSRGAPFGEIESTKSASELFVPLSVEIVEVNSGLGDYRQPLADEPCGACWMIKIRNSTPGEESELIDLQQYEELLAQEYEH